MSGQSKSTIESDDMKKIEKEMNTVTIDNKKNPAQAPTLPKANVEVQYAYHVTNVETTEQDDKKQLPWDRLISQIATHKSYDKKIIGLPCVFFTTSLYNGELPQQTMYPSEPVGMKGSYYRRVIVPLTRFDDYEIYFFDKNDKQVRLLLLNKKEQETFKPDTTMTILSKEMAKPYLRRHESKYYSNDASNRVESDEDKRCFVSFVVLHDVLLGEGVIFDNVLKNLIDKSSPDKVGARVELLKEIMEKLFVNKVQISQ